MVLVTGGTGMLGAHLISALLNDGQQVRATKRKNSSLKTVETIVQQYATNGNATQQLASIEWCEGDVLDYSFLDEVTNGVSQVYHAAAMVSFAPRDKRNMLYTNIEGTANMVNCCLAKKTVKLCHISSIAALGSAEENSEINEQSQRKPNESHSAYSTSKYKSELEVWRGIQEGLNAMIVNPSVILGAGDWKTGSPSFFSVVWKGMKFYTKGVTGYVDARDVCKASIQLMNSDICGERFVLSAENLSYQTVFTQIAQSLQKPVPQHYASPLLTGAAWRLDLLKSTIFRTKPLLTKETARTAHNHSFYSNEKVCKRLNFKFRPVNETINDIAEIFLKQRLTIND